MGLNGDKTEKFETFNSKMEARECSLTVLIKQMNADAKS